jgi:hypothetical protein
MEVLWLLAPLNWFTGWQMDTVPRPMLAETDRSLDFEASLNCAVLPRGRQAGDA